MQWQHNKDSSYWQTFLKGKKLTSKWGRKREREREETDHFSFKYHTIKATQIMPSIIRKTLLTTIAHYHSITITYSTKFNARKGTNKPRNKKRDTPQAQTQLLKTIVGVRKEHQLFIHISYYPMDNNLIHIHTYCFHWRNNIFPAGRTQNIGRQSNPIEIIFSQQLL